MLIEEAPAVSIQCSVELYLLQSSCLENHREDVKANNF